MHRLERRAIGGRPFRLGAKVAQEGQGGIKYSLTGSPVSVNKCWEMNVSQNEGW